ncbi:MAG TPA: HAMP domain-containing sensor histidine kinase, partial [Hyphomicrobiaceae bacterium]|nr:HAMP domain-containing sensor histidine kinase [Hyphomicrobiaceae bacterium]
MSQAKNGDRDGSASEVDKVGRPGNGPAGRRVGVSALFRLIEPWSGLPAKLLVLTIVFVMLAEVLIFVPSIASFRVNWLTERLTAARLASLAAGAAPGGRVPHSVRQELLETAQVKAVAIKKDMIRRLVLPSEETLVIDESFDLRRMPADGWYEAVGDRLTLIGDALRVFLAREGRLIRIYGRPSAGRAKVPAGEEFVEIVLPEAPLKAAMIRHGLNILGLSIIISMIAAALVYFALIRVLVQPMMRLSRSMLHFGEKPEDPDRIIVPSGRQDEIGTAERELAGMQRQLSQLLQQKNRLAQLGLAVSKINHDLRNMLASAQLISDRLAGLSDPTVQRFAPKLIASLDRAIKFCNSTLQFGRAEEAAPRRELFPLGVLVEEVGDGLDLPRPGLEWAIEVPRALQVDADRDYLYRVLNNICRNAVQAIEGQGSEAGGAIAVKAQRTGRVVTITVSDTGPGVPERAREHLFQAFNGGVRKGGSGLGLAISAEL